MAETFTGVIDRFEGEKAVILLEAEGETVDELVIDRQGIPEEGRSVDAVFTVQVEGEELRDISFDEEETRQRKQQVKSQFDRLSERPTSSESNN